MGALSAIDRRRKPRHWTAVPVVIRHQGARIDGVSINLSESGMYFFAAASLPLAAEIEIEFRPPGWKRMVSLYATVRRRAMYLYAIEFLTDEALAGRGFNLAVDGDQMFPQPEC